MSKRLSVPLLVFVLLCSVRLGRADTAQGNYFASNGIFGNGSADLSGAIFQSIASAGVPASGNTTGSSYRSYTGIMPMIFRDAAMITNFSDEWPASSDTQTAITLDSKITVETGGGTGILTVWYRISSTGSEDASFRPYRSDASVDTSFSSTSARARFVAHLPNSSGDSFGFSGNNYIQWKVRNSIGAEYVSSKYRLQVQMNDNPVVTILQPDAKGAVAATNPFIKAFLSDQSGIDINNVQIRLDNNATGENIAIINSAVVNGIVVSTGTNAWLEYRYDGTALQPGTACRMTVTAADTAGLTGSASVVFTANAGAIADLVPYPSPFDPRIQPITIRYALNKRSTVSVNLYDMAGRLIKNIVDNQWKEAGINEDPWNGTNYAGDTLANGVYFCEIVAKDSDGEHRRYTSLAIFGK